MNGHAEEVEEKEPETLEQVNDKREEEEEEPKTNTSAVTEVMDQYVFNNNVFCF